MSVEAFFYTVASLFFVLLGALIVVGNAIERAPHWQLKATGGAFISAIFLYILITL